MWMGPHTRVFHVNEKWVTSQSSVSEVIFFLVFFCLFFFRTMSNLYEDPDWSQKDLKETLKDVRKHVLKNKFLSCFAPDRLKYYLKELCQREQEGHQICFTDLWGLIIETMLHEKVQSQHLSLQICIFSEYRDEGTE